MRKLILTILGLLSLTATSFAEKYTAGDKSKGTEIIWEIKDGVLTISKGESNTTGKMPDYDSGTNFSPWSDYREKVNKLVVEEGITSIGNYICYNMNKIKECIFPSTLKTIGAGAFYNCTALTTANLPEGVTTLNSSCFYNTAITIVNIPKTVKTIGSSAYCPMNIKTLTFEEGSELVSIGDRAFGAWETTSGHTALTSLTLPSSLKTIGSYAFASRQGLKNVTIPASVTSIGTNPFDNCTNALIHVDPANTKYQSTDNVVYTKDSKTLILYSLGKSDTEFSIPEGVTTINSMSFYFSSKLTKINIPESVTTINARAFYKCEKLTTLNIPSKVTTLGDGFISGCKVLTNLTVAEENQNFKVVDGVVFTQDMATLKMYPTALTATKYTIPSEVKSVAAYAFSWNTNIQEIKFPEDSQVKSFGADVFYQCTGLKSIEFPRSAVSFGNETFYGCSSLNHVILSEDITTLPYRFFSGCSSLEHVDLPKKITSLGGDTFVNCKKLQELILPPFLTSIGGYSIHTCSALKELEIPDGVTSLGMYAIYNNANLHKIELSSGTKFLNAYAINSCPKLDTLCITSTTPPVAKYDAFLGSNFTDKKVKLLVPCGSTDAYKEYKTEEGLNVYNDKFNLEEVKEANFNKITLSVNDTDGGTAKVTRQPACGENPIIEAYPNVGYRFIGWNTNDEDIKDNPYEFDLTKDMAFEASFEQIMYYSYVQGEEELEIVTVSPITFENGQVEMSAIKGKYQDKVKIYTSPTKGYKQKSLSIVGKETNNPISISSVDSTIVMPAEDIIIAAEFENIDYAINIETAENGYITTDPASTANYGQTIKMTANASTDYKLASISIIKVDDKTAIHYNDETLEFTMPASDVTISATFEEIDYTVPVGGTFVVGDFKYTVTALNPNKVSAAAKDENVSGSLTLLDKVTYLGIEYTVESLTERGFADCENVTNININRNTPPTYGENALNVNILVMVPCGLRSAYETAGYPKNNIDYLTSYEYTVSPISANDNQGTASVTKQTDCDDHSAVVEATPKAGYKFKCWDNNSGLTANPYTINNVTTNKTVNAYFEAINYTISKVAPSNGSFDISKTSATIGTTISITNIKNNTGYKVGKISVTDANNNEVAVNADNTFKMPASNVNVSVSFDAVNYNISVGNMTNGSVTPSTSSATAGTEITLTVSPAIGYKVKSLTYSDGSSTKTISDNKFTMPTSNVTINATFEQVKYNITVNKEGEGTASVSSNTATYNSTITITATPKDGHYSVASIEVVNNTTSKSISVSNNIFSMPNADVTVNVKFVETAKIIVGDEFTIGNFTYKVTAYDDNNNKVSVRAKDENVKGDIVVADAVSYMDNTFKVTSIADYGFFKANSLTSVTFNVTNAPTLGTNAFTKDDDMLLQVPCNASSSFKNAGYDNYFADKNIIEYYDGYTITVNSDNVNMGSVKINREAGCGINPIVEAIANKGYRFTSWSDGSNTNPYTVSLAKNTELVAKFEHVTHYINVNEYKNGSVTVDETSFYNEEKTLTVEANNGYSIGTITITDENGNNPVTYSNGKFTMPDYDVYITVEFNAIPYDINISSTSNGSINILKSQATIYERVDVSTTPNTGYKQEELKVVDDVTKMELEITNGKFTMPANSVTIYASFQLVDYKVNVAEYSNGTVEVSQSTANYGDEIVLTAIPDDGYVLQSLVVKTFVGDIITVEDNVFVMPASNVTVTAIFEKDIVTNVNEVKSSADVNAYGINDAIIVESSETMTIQIFDISGRVVWRNDNFNGRQRVPAENGVYIVRFNDVVKNVIVR